jgi:ribosomal protein L19E
MSTDSGDRKLVDDIMADARSMVDTARAEARQMDLLDPVSAEDIVEAKEDIGASAGRMALVRHAREKKRGRPPGAQNKRTDDFARYLSQFGQHPGITMMQIQSTPPEILMEASRRIVRKMDKEKKIHEFVETMSYAEAQSMRLRAAEGLMPYFESKKPIAIDAQIRGVRVIEQRGEMKPVGPTLDVAPIRVAKDLDLEDDA